MQHRVAGDTDPLADGKAAIAAAIARVMGDALRGFGVDSAGAEPWAHGLVGLGLSTGEWWLTRQTMSAPRSRATSRPSCGTRSIGHLAEPTASPSTASCG